MEEIKKVLLIVNPVSGNLNKINILKTLEAEIIKNNIQFETYKTTGKNDIEKINAKFTTTNFDRVFVIGGDGTIKQASEALMDYNIPIAIFPAGSANGLAVNLELTNNLKEQLKIALGNNSIEMDMLEINGELCLHIGDLGVNAELIKNYQLSGLRGKIGYILQSIPTLWQSKYPFEFKIESENGNRTRKGILLAFANAKKYGTGANINPGGKIDDGIFEILLFKNFDILEILKTLGNKTDLSSEFVEVVPAKTARVICRNPVALQIDGEYIGEKKEVLVKISPKKLRVMIK